ncbi:TIGR00366 family protein [Caballeronia calidae]|uniref:TIGR00366 family protein n=1 Tax=Caballeronia calidae TaxID=1777139 RepID=UPI0012FDE89F|nr:TIGR00366 family protein [Caballeronia calidae]
MENLSKSAAQHVEAENEGLLSSLSARLIGAFERYMPDPFIVAILLTALTAALSLAFAPKATPTSVLAAWYKGLFDISGFAFLIALMLVTGYALSESPPVERFLSRVASAPRCVFSALLLAIFASALASMIHWALGLVVAGRLCRELTRNVRVDAAWLVAAAYSGFTLFSSGFSSAIYLISNTHGSNMNVVERLMGFTLPLSRTLLSNLNLSIIIALLITLPAVFWVARPRALADSPDAPDSGPDASETTHTGRTARSTFAEWLATSCVVNVFFALLCVAYFVSHGLPFDFVSVVVLFLVGGMVLHWTPRAYVASINRAARLTGPILLQFPIYGGIMGIVLSTGLADRIAELVIAVASPATLPLVTYLSSIVISLFVPSAGGHWAVQGPFVISAANHLHAPLAATIIGVAVGEGTGDMIQPMWLLPVIAITGVNIRRVMGFTTIAFIPMTLVSGLLLLLPFLHS